MSLTAFLDKGADLGPDGRLWAYGIHGKFVLLGGTHQSGH